LSIETSRIRTIARYSNLFNNLRFNPLPWMSFSVNSQLPAFAKGFTEVDTYADSPTAKPNLQVNVGHRYLNGNPFFENSSLFVVGGYLRVNDNWGLSVQEQYEGATDTLQEQRYAIYRDLRAGWLRSRVIRVTRSERIRSPVHVTLRHFRNLFRSKLRSYVVGQLIQKVAIAAKSLAEFRHLC